VQISLVRVIPVIVHLPNQGRPRDFLELNLMRNGSVARAFEFEDTHHDYLQFPVVSGQILVGCSLGN
jgi:hypothetical protein